MAKMKFEISTSSNAKQTLDVFAEEMFDSNGSVTINRDKFVESVKQLMRNMVPSKARAFFATPFVGRTAELIIEELEEMMTDSWENVFDEDMPDLSSAKLDKEEQDWVSGWLRDNGYPFDVRQLQAFYKAL